jgi:hypothetical protein
VALPHVSPLFRRAGGKQNPPPGARSSRRQHHRQRHPIDPAFQPKGRPHRAARQAGFESGAARSSSFRRRAGGQSRRGRARRSFPLRIPPRPSSSAAKTPICRRMESRPAPSKRPTPGLTFKVIGYTDEMHRWMQMSDLFIGKPGGLTTAESPGSGLPMVIVAPIPARRNATATICWKRESPSSATNSPRSPTRSTGSSSRPEQMPPCAKRRSPRPSPRRRDHRRHAAQSAHSSNCRIGILRSVSGLTSSNALFVMAICPTSKPPSAASIAIHFPGAIHASAHM